ncbi:hypothetical protein [Streptomyces sp. NPDC056323]|uniref:hypothetical protein n=1 Tax=unclassified Streptomyces TaxID=2593676 RepID=UPI0035DFD75D
MVVQLDGAKRWRLFGQTRPAPLVGGSAPGRGGGRATASMWTTHLAVHIAHELISDSRSLTVMPPLELLDQTACVWHTSGWPDAPRGLARGLPTPRLRRART